MPVRDGGRYRIKKGGELQTIQKPAQPRARGGWINMPSQPAQSDKQSVKEQGTGESSTKATEGGNDGR